MNYYLIKDKLETASYDECLKHEFAYVAVVTKDEFESHKQLFDMGIDQELEERSVSCIMVNYDSLTGCFYIPDRSDIYGTIHQFMFALDEHGIAFIDDEGMAQKIIHKIMAKKKWRAPSLARFIYDFLECIVADDLQLLENYEKQLDELEDIILSGETDGILEKLLDIRNDIIDLRTHYEQLVDISQELEENENGFFDVESLRFFRLYTERVSRLKDIVSSVRDHTMQARDLYHSQLEVKQNRTISILTVVSMIFMPLTLIAGWYGMNFKYMPELSWKYGYLFVSLLSLGVVALLVIIGKKKKWF